MSKRSDSVAPPGGSGPRAMTIAGLLGSQRWAGVAALIALAILPSFHSGYWLSQLTFVAIYAIAGFGLQILLGFAGQVSLGQAAFLASGAYACAYVERIGLGAPAGFLAAIAVATALGLLVALPALRMSGLYLAIATMSFGFIVEEVAARWTSVTGGNAGIAVPAIRIGHVSLGQPWQIYYLSWAFFLVVLLLSANLPRTPVGRAMVAIRDSEIAARSSGIRVSRTKGVAFGLSAAFAGLAGALYGHALGFISPDQFTIAMSLDLLVMILIGGLGTLRGVVFGSIFLVVSPELFQQLIGLFTSGNTEVAGLRPFLFGFSLIFVLLFQPNGIDALVTRAGEWFATARSR
jgi:branched-chain amino acid transport system permease protein